MLDRAGSASSDSPLPPQAKGLDVQSDLLGGEIIPTGSGFALTAPVPPGDHNISFTFSFPYQGDAIAYRQSLLQGAEVYQVLVPDRLSQIQVGSLESMPPLEVGEVSYRVWEGGGFAPGQGVEVRLTNLPEPSLLVRLGKSVTRGTFWRVAIPVMLGVVLAESAPIRRSQDAARRGCSGSGFRPSCGPARCLQRELGRPNKYGAGNRRFG